MREKEISFLKSLSLKELSSEVGTCEAQTGTLKKLDHTDAKTIVVYDRGLAPSPCVELFPGTGVPAGYSKISTGQVWILNQLQAVSAGRKNS
jgi:hypothetical protein